MQPIPAEASTSCQVKHSRHAFTSRTTIHYTSRRPRLWKVHSLAPPSSTRHTIVAHYAALRRTAVAASMLGWQQPAVAQPAARNRLLPWLHQSTSNSSRCRLCLQASRKRLFQVTAHCRSWLTVTAHMQTCLVRAGSMCTGSVHDHTVVVTFLTSRTLPVACHIVSWYRRPNTCLHMHVVCSLACIPFEAMHPRAYSSPAAATNYCLGCPV